MKRVYDVLDNFRGFLSSSWKHIEGYIELDTTGSFKEDWLQSNWEWLVEGQMVNERDFWLESYGDEADAYEDSSRILYPDKRPTHRIAKSSSQSTVRDILTGLDVPTDGLVFDKFATEKDGWYIESPPFDCVMFLSREGKEYLVKFEDCEFEIQKL